MVVEPDPASLQAALSPLFASVRFPPKADTRGLPDRAAWVGPREVTSGLVTQAKCFREEIPTTHIFGHFDKDVLGWTRLPGMVDDLGNPVEQREYSGADMDRLLVLNQRTKLVAQRVMQYLSATDPMAKTIIFCEDIDHAERMRQAMVNAAGKLARDNPKYVMRITGDSVEGKAQLDNFIDPEQPYPVIVTTSQLLTTGVYAKTCKLIVLDRTINSITMFKQIIGRGTRHDEDNSRADRAPFDSFWTAMGRPHSPWSHSAADMALTGIYMALGIERLDEASWAMWKRW